MDTKEILNRIREDIRSDIKKIRELDLQVEDKSIKRKEYVENRYKAGEHIYSIKRKLTLKGIIADQRI